MQQEAMARHIADCCWHCICQGEGGCRTGQALDKEEDKGF